MQHLLPLSRRRKHVWIKGKIEEVWNIRKSVMNSSKKMLYARQQAQQMMKID